MAWYGPAEPPEEDEIPDWAQEEIDDLNEEIEECKKQIWVKETQLKNLTNPRYHDVTDAEIEAEVEELGDEIEDLEEQIDEKQGRIRELSDLEYYEQLAEEWY